MDRDIIVIWSNCDCCYITLNGYEVGYGIERGYEIGDVLIALFDKMNYSSNKPIIVDIYDENSDFLREELDKFYIRFDNEDSDKFFSEDELQVLYETEDVNKFINKIRENLKESKIAPIDF